MHYDYIFCGYGLSAMIVLDSLLTDGLLDDKSVLILDSGTSHEKTWCFWESGGGNLDALLTRQWSEAFFIDRLRTEILKRRYRYKMLEPQSLETYVSGRLAGQGNTVFRMTSVLDIADNGHYATVTTDAGIFKGRKVFSSIAPPIQSSLRYPLLLQHFRGRVVETDGDHFSDAVTFMDFSIQQSGQTRFLYVLPFSPRKALVEYTLFSPSLLPDSEYETALAEYLDAQGIGRYTIAKEEKGVIPMTAYPFWRRNTRNVLQIGTAGGWTKPSTGYTLVYAQKQSERLSGWLAKGRSFADFHKKSRFYIYDRILVSILYHDNSSGKSIFTTLFRRADPILVLKFLREETTVFEDLVVLWSCPKRLFLKQVMKQVLRRAHIMR